jgi:hypothetical protein
LGFTQFRRAVLAQTGCPNPFPLLPLPDSWPNCASGCSITVNVAINTTWTNSLGGTGTLTAKQVQDITNGITSWNGVNGITFNVTSGAGATPPPGSAYSYKVSVGTTSDPDSNGGETTITGAGQGCGGNCSNNDTTIIQYTQSNLANDAVLQQIAAHETGHTIGLGDVLPCNSNSVMSAALRNL